MLLNKKDLENKFNQQQQQIQLLQLLHVIIIIIIVNVSIHYYHYINNNIGKVIPTVQIISPHPIFNFPNNIY